MNNTHYSEVDIDIERGMLMGKGVNLRTNSNELENVYIPWSDLNSHFMCFGTTRMGKTRLLIFMMRQIIEKGDHLFLVEPKGSDENEVLSWVYQYAVEFNCYKDIVYWSPERPDSSIKMNLLFGQDDEEAASTVIGAMKVDDEFYEDIANEILMGVLPALSFFEETVDPIALEIMYRREYMKAKVEEPVNNINKRMLGDLYDYTEDEAKADVTTDFYKKAGSKEEKQRVLEAHTLVENMYKNPPAYIPFRRFVTFEDIARYSSQVKIAELLEKITATVNDAIKKGANADTIKRGRKAEAELKKLSERDKGYFSKVSTSYAVTLTRLSTGNVGRLLCESKINTLRDDFYRKDKRIIFIAQPFPMKYTKAADMSIKMLMSMMNSVIGDVGVSGVANYKRTHVMVDEAGSITNALMLSLANKGGGLGLSLYLYSQSFADYKNVLGEDGSVILADNANTKGFFLVNDENSAATISALIGGAKKGDVTYASSEGENSRVQGRAVEEALIPPSLITQLAKMTFVLKAGSEVYMMAAPFQRDPCLNVIFEGTSMRLKVQSVDKFLKEQIDRDL